MRRRVVGNWGDVMAKSETEDHVVDTRWHISTISRGELNASRESSKAASDKLMEVNGQLGDIMAQLAKIDVQKQNVSCSPDWISRAHG